MIPYLMLMMKTILFYPIRAAVYIMLSLSFAPCVSEQPSDTEALQQVKNYLQSHRTVHSRAQFDKVIGNIDASGYDISGSLPPGYVKDGSIDYTTYIQQAINQHDDLIFPGFPVMVSDVGLQLRSNQNIKFEKGSKIILKPSAKGNYDIISIRNCSNVTLLYPNITGDKTSHTGSGGEWGMGIGIYASVNVQILTPDISNTWGDGIYIGTNSTLTPSSEVYVEGGTINNSRRNGISITCARNVTLANLYISRSSGTLPEDGIDVEPNSPTDVISNINITSVFTEQNKGYGVEFSLSKMYGGPNQQVDAMVSDHVDQGSKSAVYVSCDPENASHGETVSGIITFHKPVWKDFGEYVWRPYGMQEKNIILAVVNPQLIANGKALDTNAATAELKKEIFPMMQVFIFNVTL